MVYGTPPAAPLGKAGLASGLLQSGINLNSLHNLFPAFVNNFMIFMDIYTFLNYTYLLGIITFKVFRRKIFLCHNLRRYDVFCPMPAKNRRRRLKGALRGAKRRGNPPLPQGKAGKIWIARRRRTASLQCRTTGLTRSERKGAFSCSCDCPAKTLFTR